MKVRFIVGTADYDGDGWRYTGEINFVILPDGGFVYQTSVLQAPSSNPNAKNDTPPKYSIDGVHDAVISVGNDLGVPISPDKDLESIKAAKVQDKFYVKKSKSKNHAANEVLANDLYKLGGVPTPDVFIGDDGITVGSRILEGDRQPIDKATPEQLSRAREDVVFDAWLANWDAVGLSYDNIVLMDGIPFRIDAGGSLLYRAQGSPKGAHFGNEAKEIDTLRDPSMNKQAAKIFQDTTLEELHAGGTRLAAIDPSVIKEIVGNSDVDNPSDLSDKLIARRAWLLQRLGVKDPFAGTKESTASSVVPKTAKKADVSKPSKPNKPVEADLQLNKKIEVLEELSIEQAVTMLEAGEIPKDERLLIVPVPAPIGTNNASHKSQVMNKGNLPIVGLPEYYATWPSVGEARLSVKPLKNLDSYGPVFSVRKHVPYNSETGAHEITGRVFRIKQGPTFNPGAVTLAANGDIVVNKQVIGKWSLENGWSKKITFTIDGEFSPTGEQIELTQYGKSDTRRDIASIALVGDVQSYVPANSSVTTETDTNPNLKVIGVVDKMVVGNTYICERVDGYKGLPVIGVAQYAYPDDDTEQGDKLIFVGPLYDDGAGMGGGSGPVFTSHLSGSKFTQVEPLPDDLQPALASFKPDGTIVSKGQVIGTYTKTYGNQYNYTVYAAYSPTGKNFNGKTSSKADARLAVMAFAVVPSLPGPSDVEKKNASKALKSATEKVSGLTVGGKPVVVGTRVEHIDSGVVGTVTNWPNQEKYPNLVYVMTDDGHKKTINIKKLKLKVDEVEPGAYEAVAFAGVKTADGKTPVVGQKIKTGKSGHVGVLLKVNEKNGYVTVLLDDGTKKTTTLATTYVLEEPSSEPAATIASKVDKIASKSSTKKVVDYSLTDLQTPLAGQDDASKTKFLAKGKRKLMSDGAVPYVGMYVQDNKGNKFMVAEIPDQWSSSPNGLRLIPVGTDAFSLKFVTKQTQTLHVDIEGENSKGTGISSVSQLSASYGGTVNQSTDLLPAGALLFRRASKGDRSDLGSAAVIFPDGSYAAGNNLSHRSQLDKAQLLNFMTDPDWVLVGHGNPESSKSYAVTTGYIYNSSGGSETAGLTPTSFVYDTADLKDGMTVEKLIADFNKNKFEQSGLTIPEHVAVGNPLIPPPMPEELKTKTKIDFPQPSGEQKQNFKRKPLVPKAKSVSDAIVDMLGKKDSTEPGSSVSFASLDSSSLVDQQVRFQVVVGPDGTEYMETRFKLMPGTADAIGTKIVSSESKNGAWVSQGVTVKDLADGDAISVREGSTAGSKVLKPSSGNQPNARIVGEPVKVADAQGPGTYDTYRFKVIMSTGEVGEVDIQDRSADGGTVYKYEYDWTKVVSGAALSLTTDAEQEGWARLGHNGQFPVSSVDSTGKKIYSSFTSINQQTSDGSMLSRQLSDGTMIRFNYAHESEGKDAYKNPRWRTTNNEVIVMTPIKDANDTDAIEKSVSDAMEVLGVSDDVQVPPTVEDIQLMAVRKLAWQFDKDWKPGKDYGVTANPNDTATKAVLADVGKQIGLGRPLELSDLRVYTEPNGRVFIGLSNEVAAALSKKQGTTFYRHSISGQLIDILSHPVNGLLSTDERWSRGVLTHGMSSSTDMNYGSGDRVYLRAGSGKPSGTIVIGATALNRSLDSYSSSGDGFGTHHDNWTTGYTSSGNETMYKGSIPPEMFGFILVSDPGKLISDLKDRGVTMIGNRKLEDVIKSSTSAEEIKDTGLDFDDGAPLTSLGGE